MAHEQLKNGNAFRFIKEYWFIVVFIVSFAMAWSNFGAELKAQRFIDDKQEILIHQNSSEIDAVQLQYAQDVSIIKTQLEQLIKQDGTK